MAFSLDDAFPSLDFPWDFPASGERALSGACSAWRTQAQLERLGRSPRGEGETFRFAVLGDVEPGRFWIFRKLFNIEGMFEGQLREIQEERVDFSMQMGDMVSRGKVGHYLRFFSQLERVSPAVPYLSVIGNHDRHYPHGISNADLYRRAFGRTNYYFDRGPARFVALDTSARRLLKSQLEWLRHALDTPKRKIVFTHIPPVQLASWTRYAGTRHVGGFSIGAEAFTRVVAERGVDRVYLGHIHAFGVQDYLGVRYVLTGGGGSPLFPCGVSDRFHHYLVSTVGPKGVRETLRCADGGRVEVPAGKILLHNPD